PKEVKALFKRSCYDCHSYETKWPWYSKIAPASWFIAKHVHDGRAWLNFSIWEKYDDKKKRELKNKIFRSVAFAMPLPMYLWVHKDAKLTEEEKDKIRYWASDGKMVIQNEKGF
ncbi:MAG: heme-binding domain-containing protein, partial [Epsilonproteobacteria bacterium]|nr:heme-binding domain-containing protein [Campylobacterota bacterium]